VKAVVSIVLPARLVQRLALSWPVRPRAAS